MDRIEHEMLEKTEEPPKILEENREEYLRRLTRAAALIEDDIWDSFSEEAKIWANNSIDLMNEEKDPEDFWEFFGTDEGDEDGNLLDPKDARRKVEQEKRRQPDERFANPYNGPTKRKPGRKPTKKAKGSAKRAKEMFLEQPDLEIDELLAELIREGHTMSRTTLISVRAEFRNSLKTLVDKGYLDPNKHYFGFPLDDD